MMERKETNVFDSPKLIEYRAMETRLYGELLKSCRFYQNKLSLISILGILELVGQEVKELDRTNIKNNDEDLVSNRDILNQLL